jgi:hypothetical protein
LTFEAVANTVYKIAADGKHGVQGSIDLRVESRPKNDDFGSAETIRSKIPVFWPGSTLLATKQVGEPNHAGDPGGHSVWYSWTAGGNGKVVATACTSTFDPLLAVYTGAALESLTPVATVSGESDGCEQGTSRMFTVAKGVTYRFAVDGAGGEDGHFELLLKPLAADPPVVMPPSPAPGGGGGGSAAPPSPAPVPQASIKPAIRCKHGFKKVRIKGIPRCVKRKWRRHGRRPGKHPVRSPQASTAA